MGGGKCRWWQGGEIKIVRGVGSDPDAGKELVFRSSWIREGPIHMEMRKRGVQMGTAANTDGKVYVSVDSAVRGGGIGVVPLLFDEDNYN